MDSENEKKGVMGSLASGADTVFGDVILGGLGQGAYYATRVPGLKQASQYVGENIKDGWNKAEGRHQRAAGIRVIQELTSQKKQPTSTEIRAAARKAGLSEDNIRVVEEGVAKVIAAKHAATENLNRGKETPGAASPATAVPLPKIEGSLGLAGA